MDCSHFSILLGQRGKPLLGNIVKTKGEIVMGYVMNLRKLVGSRPLVIAGASVIVVDEEKRLLLQLRKDNHCWGLAGGSLEPGETLEDVAKRELQEETGLIANELTYFQTFSGNEFYYKYPNGDE